MPDAEILHGIIVELIRAIEELGADERLLAILGSYDDTLDDEEILALLKEWNG